MFKNKIIRYIFKYLQVFMDVNNLLIQFYYFFVFTFLNWSNN